MLFDLFTLDNDFGYNSEDAEQYVANVHMETFLLLKELLHTCEILEEEVILLETGSMICHLAMSLFLTHQPKFPERQFI